MVTASRNERQLMRQRGAGTRNINNNIDFGLSFPASMNARRSTTPSTNRRASRRATKTPVQRSASQEPTATAEIAAPTTTKRANKRKSSFLDAVTERPDPLSIKKRRLNDTTATSAGQTDEGSVNGQPTSRRKASRKSNFIAIAEEPSDEEVQDPTETDEEVADVGPDELLIDLEADKENDELDEATTKPKRRKKRKSIAQRPKKRSSTGFLQEQPIGQGSSTAGEPLRARVRKSLSAARSSVEATLHETKIPLPLPDPLPLKIRQQDGIAVPTKGPPSDSHSLSNSHVTERQVAGRKSATSRRQESIPVDDGQDADDSALAGTANEASKRRRKRKSVVVKKRSGRAVSAQSTASASAIRRLRQPIVHTASPTATPYRDAESDEDESYMPEEVSPEPPTPVLVKKPRKNTRTIPSTEHDNPARRSTSTEPRQSGLPITTHRLTNVSALPNITEEEDQASDDELQEAHLGTSRTAPNAVDVLAQITRETVASALSNTRTSTTGSELKLRTEALEAFGKEMDSRLFDMSAAVENRLTLEARVRASKREKSEVQARWIEVRREREEVALRMDRVRREHWADEEVGAESWKLSESLHGVEIGLERGKGKETETLDFLLRTVGSVGGHESGGVLQRVRGFNDQIEKLVDVLEGSG